MLFSFKKKQTKYFLDEKVTRSTNSIERIHLPCLKFRILSLSSLDLVPKKYKALACLTETAKT